MIIYDNYNIVATLTGTNDIGLLRYALRVAWEHTTCADLRDELDALYLALSGKHLTPRAEHSGEAPLNSVQAFLQRQEEERNKCES